MSTSDAPIDPVVQVRRLLHTNYNCTDVERLERFYIDVFAMKNVMRRTSDDTPGVLFGLEMYTAQDTIFLYDHRGARRITSLELVQWLNPPTFGSVYPNPWDHGIQAAGFAAPDLAAVRSSAESAGATIIAEHDDALVLRDPEDLPVEVYRGDNAEIEQRHLRIVVRDLDATVAWWSKLGFTLTHNAFHAPQGGLWPEAADRAVNGEAAMVAADEKSFALIFETWAGPPPVGPTYGAPFHQGLYRMAMAVDDVHAAWAALVEVGMAVQPPYTFAMPGTKITDGLTILFIRDPDGILVELVERPRSHFVSVAR
jgi:catechol 2,3-dioxygenase-like lactoylglutathione lyase family enzyme